MPHSARSLPPMRTSLAPHDSKARLRTATTRRSFMAKPCTPHPHCAARAALRDWGCQCAGSRGRAPCVLLGDLKGAILSRERMAPLLRTPARCGRTKDAAPSGCSPFRARRVPKTALTRLCCKRGTTFRFKKRQERAAFPPLLPAAQDTFSVIYLEGKTTASSVCALTR